MGRYSDADLKTIEREEPDRAFYLRHEEEFMALGIDMTLDNWDSVIIGDMVPMSGENRYSYLRRSLQDGGVLVLDGEGNLRKVDCYPMRQEPIVSTTLTDSDDELPQFVGDPPTAPQRPGRLYRFLRAITFGLYRPEVQQMYEARMRGYSRELKRYTAEKQRFDEQMLDGYRARTVGMEKYNAALAARGKTADMQKAYRDALKKHSAHMEEENRVLDINRVSFANTLRRRQEGRERLDFIFGPRLPEEERAKKIADCNKQTIFKPNHFGEPQPGDTVVRIKDVDLPEGCPFDAHQFAIFGYAATCNRETVVRCYTQPDPDKPPVHDRDSITNDLFIDCVGMWYNWVDGIITRQPRTASGSQPLIDYAKANALDAVKKYMQGDAADLGRLVVDSLRWSIEQISIQCEAADAGSFPDYGRICGDMLALVDKDKYPQLYDAAIAAGLTQKDIENAKTCANMSKVWDAGIEAIALLTAGKDANGNDLSYEQKVSAAADIAGMRMTQEMLKQRYKEMTETPEYQKLTLDITNETDKADRELRRANKAVDKAMRDNDPNLEQLKKVQAEKQRAFTVATRKSAYFTFSFLTKDLGVDVNPNDMMVGTFSSDTRPQEIHDMFAESDTIAELCKQPCIDVYTALTQKNAGKVVHAAMPQPKVQRAPQANAPQVQAQMAK